MKRTIARGVLTAAATGAVLALTSTTAAFADDCVNLSRNTNGDQATHGAKMIAGPGGEPTAVKGHWVYLGDVWLFITPGTQEIAGVDVSSLPGANGNFTDGKGDGLLEQSGKASDGRRCAAMARTGNGMAGECGEEAAH